MSGDVCQVCGKPGPGRYGNILVCLHCYESGRLLAWEHQRSPSVHEDLGHEDCTACDEARETDAIRGALRTHSKSEFFSEPINCRDGETLVEAVNRKLAEKNEQIAEQQGVIDCLRETIDELRRKK